MVAFVNMRITVVDILKAVVFLKELTPVKGPDLGKSLVLVSSKYCLE